MGAPLAENQQWQFLARSHVLYKILPDLATASQVLPHNPGKGGFCGVAGGWHGMTHSSFVSGSEVGPLCPWIRSMICFCTNIKSGKLCLFGGLRPNFEKEMLMKCEAKLVAY